MRQTPTNRPLIPLGTDLGPGEADLIGLRTEYDNSGLILDDLLGRRIARLHELTFTGTVGVVKGKQIFSCSTMRNCFPFPARRCV